MVILSLCHCFIYLTNIKFTEWDGYLILLHTVIKARYLTTQLRCTSFKINRLFQISDTKKPQTI